MLLAFSGIWLIGIWINKGRDPNQTAGSESISSREQKKSQDCPIQLKDVTQAVGLNLVVDAGSRGHVLPEDMGAGVAWADVDADGDWDLYVVASFRSEKSQTFENALFLNEQGSFVPVPAAGGISNTDVRGMGASFADFDNDGLPDLYLSNEGPNRLFRNLGNGRFEDVTEAAGVAGDGWSAGVAWGDVDRDGDLDLYVTNYVAFDWTFLPKSSAVAVSGYHVPYTLNPSSFDPQGNHLYLNQGDGHFVDVASEVGVVNADGRSLAVILCDLNGDGWLDIYVNNDVSTNRLFVNTTAFDGFLSFLDLSTETGTADVRGSMGLTAGRALHDEREHDLPDLFLTHWVAQDNAYYVSMKQEIGHTFEYRDRSRQLLIGEVSVPYVGWGCAFTDLDGDGFPEIIVNNGSTLEQNNDSSQLRRESGFVFWNQRNHFLDVTEQTPFAEPRSGRGLAVCDFDNDGDPDILISENRGAITLMRNNTSIHHWLRIRLDASDALRFGARVEVVTAHKQIQWFGADVSYLSQHAPELIFGLGDREKGVVTVHWANGTHTGALTLGAGLHKLSSL